MKPPCTGGETPPEPKEVPETHLDRLVAMRDGLAISIEERQAQLAVFEVSIKHELLLMEFEEVKNDFQSVQ